MKKLITVLVYLLLCILFWGIGYLYPSNTITILDGTSGDCFYKDNPMKGIPYAEYYVIKFAIQADRYRTIEFRLRYFLEEHYYVLSYVSDNHSCINHQKIIYLQNRIRMVLDSSRDCEESDDNIFNNNVIPIQHEF